MSHSKVQTHHIASIVPSHSGSITSTASIAITHSATTTHSASRGRRRHRITHARDFWRCGEEGVRLARKVPGDPCIPVGMCSHKRLRLAQLLGQLGVVLTSSCIAFWCCRRFSTTWRFGATSISNRAIIWSDEREKSGNSDTFGRYEASTQT
jgi:hypothetical protein